MLRYARIVGRAGIGRAMVEHWIVVQADRSYEAELLARGFAVVPQELTIEEVCSRYGVSVIYVLTDGAMVEN